MTRNLPASLLRMWCVADRQARRLAIGALLMVLAASCVATTAPLILKQLVDVIAEGRLDSNLENVSYLIVVYTLLHWLSRAASEGQQTVLSRTDQRLNRELSSHFLEHVMAIPYHYHLNAKAGALSQTLANGVVGYRIVLRHFVTSLLPLFLQFTTIVAIFVAIDHVIFVAVIGLTILLYLLVFWVGAVQIGERAKDASAAHILTGAVFTDSVLNVEAVKYFGGESLIAARFQSSLKHLECRYNKLYDARLKNGIAVACIFASSLAYSVFLAAEKTRAGHMSVGEFVLVNAYILQLARPIELLGLAIREISQGLAFVNEMNSLLAVQQEHDAPNCQRSLPPRPDLFLENVSLAYRGTQNVLSNLTFTIRYGTTVAIVGQSGSGKTSLVRLLTRLIDPTSGRILIGNTSLSDVSMSMSRRAFAVVPQDTILFDASIAFNIAFGTEYCSQQDIVRAAKAADLHDFIVGLPDGYCTEVGERGLKLSGGERQRIALARAALREPDFFLFDEATSSLDSDTERQVLDAFKKVTARKTTIIITHRLPIVVHADEIIVLQKGRMIERGVHTNLMNNDGVYAAMWRLQHQGTRRRGQEIEHFVT